MYIGATECKERLPNGSGVSREAPAPFCERPEGQFLWPTHHKLYWHLDITFNEDKSKIRAGHGPENFSLLKKCVLNLLKMDNTKKESINQKRKEAAYSVDYRLHLLGVK